MPNHYSVCLICVGGYDFDVKDFNDRHNESDLCGIVMPVPEELRDVHSGHSSGGRRNWKKAEDGTELAVDEDHLIRLYGHANWYDWSVANWGTKWGTYNVESSLIGGDGSLVMIKFQCACGPPTILPKICEWLHKIHKFRAIRAIGFDPSDDSFHDLHTVEWKDDND